MGDAHLALVMHPELVMPHAATRLAIPVRPLDDDIVTLDIFGLSGVILLGASVVSEGSGSRSIRLSQHLTSKALASCTSSLQLLGPNAEIVGNVCASASRHNEYCLRDVSGTCRLLLRWEAGRRVSVWTPTSGGHVADIGTVEFREAGRLSSRHYEMVICPGVDAVPPLVCFLALMVFVKPVQKASLCEIPDHFDSPWPA